MNVIRISLSQNEEEVTRLEISTELIIDPTMTDADAEILGNDTGRHLYLLSRFVSKGFANAATELEY